MSFACHIYCLILGIYAEVLWHHRINAVRLHFPEDPDEIRRVCQIAQVKVKIDSLLMRIMIEDQSYRY
jgi:hypothetical protein